MKKSLLVVSTLAALAMLFVSCGNPSGGKSDPTPDPVTPIECDMSASAWGWGYNSTVANDADGNIAITLTDGYGAGSFGYDPAKDLTGYTKMVVEIESVAADDPWYQIIVQTDNNHKVAQDAWGTGAKTIEIDLTAGTLTLSEVKQVMIQGKAAGDVITVKSVTIK